MQAAKNFANLLDNLRGSADLHHLSAIQHFLKRNPVDEFFAHEETPIFFIESALIDLRNAFASALVKQVVCGRSIRINSHHKTAVLCRLCNIYAAFRLTAQCLYNFATFFSLQPLQNPPSFPLQKQNYAIGFIIIPWYPFANLVFCKGTKVKAVPELQVEANKHELPCSPKLHKNTVLRGKNVRRSFEASSI